MKVDLGIGCRVEELNRTLLTMLWSLVGAAVLLGTVVVAVTVIAHRRQRSIGGLPADQLLEVQAQLMQFVRSRTKNQDMRVDLDPFWRSTGLNAAQRFVALESLLDEHDLRARSSDDTEASGFVLRLGQLFARPARYVSLSELEWSRLKNEGVPNIHVQQGSGGIVQIGDHNSASSVQELSPAFVEELILALRSDAGRSPGVEGEKASSIADSLEIDLKKKRWSSIGDTVKSAVSLAASSASLLVATSRLLLG